jgi:hypothetical protein
VSVDRVCRTIEKCRDLLSLSTVEQVLHDLSLDPTASAELREPLNPIARAVGSSISPSQGVL